MNRGLMLLLLVLTTAAGCATGYHCYSGCCVADGYRPAPPLRHAPYEPFCPCHAPTTHSSTLKVLH